MLTTDEFLIEKTIELYETTTGWGDSDEWTNQDFVILSEKIQDKTGVALSHVTLKRVWGKVKYDSLPNTHTLDTLVQFLGYENWREFKSQNSNGNGNKNGVKQNEVLKQQAIENIVVAEDIRQPLKKNKSILKVVLFIVIPIAVVIFFLLIYNNKKKSIPEINDSDYSFSSKKVVSEGVPNTVIFNYDATKSPYNSVIIQQSWDKTLQVKVPKDLHQHTSIYYYPDYYKAKLIVGNKIVSTHRLLIKSNGWIPIVAQSPVPVYFNKEDAMVNGKMSLSVKKLQSRNIKMQPAPPFVLYSNVRDFGEIYSDNFSFETSLKNDYSEGASVCQLTTIYILCEGTAIGIPLSIKGCVSDNDMLFTNYFASGKQTDLSGFGVDFNSFVKVGIECKNRKANIIINDKIVYTINHDIIKAKIVGIDFRFQGTGSVDYVKLSNSKVNYEDDF
jgi:hypothetical protein